MHIARFEGRYLRVIVRRDHKGVVASDRRPKKAPHVPDRPEFISIRTLDIHRKLCQPQLCPLQVWHRRKAYLTSGAGTESASTHTIFCIDAACTVHSDPSTETLVPRFRTSVPGIAELTRTPQNAMQATTIPVQFVPVMRVLVFDFGAYADVAANLTSPASLLKLSPSIVIRVPLTHTDPPRQSRPRIASDERGEDYPSDPLDVGLVAHDMRRQHRAYCSRGSEMRIQIRSYWDKSRHASQSLSLGWVRAVVERRFLHLTESILGACCSWKLMPEWSL
eukprot:3490189-Rhodomonas_salina.3